MKLGICMAGNEEAFERALSLAVPSKPQTFWYMEVGLGAMETFRASQDWLKASGRDFVMVGIDRPEFNLDAQSEIRKEINVLLYNCGSTEYLLRNTPPCNFALIDGCHAHDCFYRDFLGVERCISDHGVVAIHDVNPECQHVEPQPHCGEPIRVRQACEELGLIPCVRPGWKLIEETGQNAQGGRGLLILQRV